MESLEQRALKDPLWWVVDESSMYGNSDFGNSKSCVTDYFDASNHQSTPKYGHLRTAHATCGLGPVNAIEKPSLAAIFSRNIPKGHKRRIECSVLSVRERNATQCRGKMAPARRGVPQKGLCGVIRAQYTRSAHGADSRSFGVTKLLSSCLA